MEAELVDILSEDDLLNLGIEVYPSHGNSNTTITLYPIINRDDVVIKDELVEPVVITDILEV